MDFAMLIQRDTGSGPGPYPDVTKIPTPPLQAAAVTIIFTLPSIALIIFSLRIYTRVTMRMLGVDDLLCGLALVTTLLLTTCIYMFFKLNYYGWHDEDVPEDWTPNAGLWFNFLYQMMYNPILALVKCSILVFLLRLGGHQKSIFIVIWSIIGIVIGHAVAVFFAALFQCVPIRTNWTPSLRADPDTKCINTSFHIIQSAINILTDFLVLAVPFWIFLQLRMPNATKVAVLGVFAIGIAVPIVAIVRLVNMYRLLFLGERVRHHNIAYVWTAVEVNLALICCSMPALRPLLSRWFPKLFGGSSDQATTPQGGSYGNMTFGGTKPTSSRNTAPRSSAYALRDLGGRKNNLTEIRGTSPTGSEEQIMTYNGILKSTNFQVQYEEAKRGDADSNVSEDDTTRPRQRQEL
ncbi:hypothetical protein B0T11DRAFT_332842 [Plectosphaerella cucumerina]|uniref:Rhodopsin domain-containing protein n=1 Tax=Plectosphaerella cucumerina TaxID=40658 RepID=A0A8K0T9A6_9PEZI|nr:hypothetical protein B0T11DRAFT_332842 [Plectosphaerella cucumerina]